MKKALFGLAAIAAASLCHAAPYAEFSLGAARQTDVCDDVAGAVCDKSGTGFKLLGGYTLTPHWSVEGSYFNFGKYRLNGSTFSGTVKVDAFGVGGAYLYDFTPEITGVARLGIASAKVKLDANSGSASFSTNESSTDPYWGLGADYKIAPNWSVGASYDEVTGKNSHVGLLGIGVKMSF